MRRLIMGASEKITVDGALEQVQQWLLFLGQFYGQ